MKYGLSAMLVTAGLLIAAPALFAQEPDPRTPADPPAATVAGTPATTDPAPASNEPAPAATGETPAATPVATTGTDTPPTVTPPARPAAATVPTPLDLATAYEIGPEDVLEISVWKNPELSRTVPVRPDGKVSLPLVNDIQAAGLTPGDLRDQVTAKLSEYIPAPEVSVIVREVHSR